MGSPSTPLGPTIPKESDTIARFIKASRLPAPARKVFEWHQSADALRTLIPPSEPVTVLKAAPSLADGQTAELLVRVLPGIHVRWIARHRGLINRGDDGGEFVDEQIRGPFRSWVHHHIIRSDGRNHCILEDRVEYSLPLGLIGDALGGALVRRKLDKIFAYRHEATLRVVSGTNQRTSGVPDLPGALDTLRDAQGRSLRSLTDERPTLVVLLRHSGCTFCRQTLADLSRRQNDIARAGVGLAVVGMAPNPDSMQALGRNYGISDAAWFADPDRLLYRALHLRRGSVLQLFGPRVWIGGFAALFRGHGIGRLEGDAFQMPGAFVIHGDRVLRAYRHRTAADRPDLGDLACSIN